MKKKILFLVTPSIPLFKKLSYVEPPLGSTMVMGGLMKSGYDVEAYDLGSYINELNGTLGTLSKGAIDYLANLLSDPNSSSNEPPDLKIFVERICGLVSASSPDYIALSMNRVSIKKNIFDVSYGFAATLAAAMKEKFNKPVMIGGGILSAIGTDEIHASITASKKRFADYIFFDDGAIALPALLSELERPDPDIKGFAKKFQVYDQRILEWNDNGASFICKEVVGGASYLLEREISLIEPSFDFVNRGNYHKSFREIFPEVEGGDWTERSLCIIPYKFIYGCSNKCAFCKAALDKMYAKPVEDVVSSLKKLNDLGYSCFRFLNSQINFDEDYANAFCRKIIASGLNIRFSDSACLRHISKETCALLKKAGCVKLWFGLESPNDRILKAMKKNLNMVQAREGIKAAHDAGIWIGVNIIVGFPHETEEEFQALLRFIEEHKSIVNCWSFSTLEVHYHTPLFMRPEVFGIRVHEKHSRQSGILGFSFSEIGGRDAIERQRVAEKRADICYKLVSGSRHKMEMNDQLTFALYNGYKKKEKVARTLDKYIKNIQSVMPLRNAITRLNQKSID